ncbi:MAG TPA: D-inositol-3-phosphate glycosyltransferase [Jiangellales bacterium]|nr:D-inositol-3-phosphate glycosyltransferase [Jiangellales bacterium]
MSLRARRGRSRTHRGGRDVPRRVAMLSVHTSPLDQPGTGDAGGLNVYVVELARRLAALDVEVEVFTRATSSDLPPTVEAAPGVLVRHVTAGPYEGLDKGDLPAQLCAFTSGVLRAEAAHEPGWYDLVHSHYWLSGQVGWLAKERWGVPLVHSMHTMAKVKNASLAEGDAPEPRARVIGEEQVVAAADRLVANTDDEAAQLVDLYGADPRAVVTVHPGVDLDVFTPGDAAAARSRLRLPRDAVVLLFAGRIQPLKAPDVVVRAAAAMVAEDPSLRERLVVAVVGGPSGSGLEEPEALVRLARALDVDDVVRFEPPVTQAGLADWYRAADLVAVPSYSESFGLVALEAQACGTPVVAAAVGGLRTAVRDGVSGLLVDGHDPQVWAQAMRGLVDDEGLARRLAAGAVTHAARFGWAATAAQVLDVYAAARADLRTRLGGGLGSGAGLTGEPLVVGS